MLPQRHNVDVGYDMQLIEHYYPKTIENRIKAIYYDTSPEVQMLMTADERDKHLEGLADW